MDNKLNTFYNVIEDIPKFARPYMVQLKKNKKISTAIVQATEIRAFLTYLATEHNIFRISDLKISDMEEVDSDVLDTYFLQVSANSRIIKISYLNMFFMYLVKERLIPYNPFWDYSAPSGTPVKKTTITHQEFKDTIIGIASGLNLSEREAKFADRTQLRDMAIISLIYYGKLSLSECAAVNVSDIIIGDDLSESLMIISDICQKEHITNKCHLIQSWMLSPAPFGSDIYNEFHKKGILTLLDRTVYLEPRLCAILLSYLSEWEEYIDGPLFYSLRNKRISERSIEHLVAKHFDRYADIHATTYSLSTSY